MQFLSLSFIVLAAVSVSTADITQNGVYTFHIANHAMAHTDAGAPFTTEVITDSTSQFWAVSLNSTTSTVTAANVATGAFISSNGVEALDVVPSASPFTWNLISSGGQDIFCSFGTGPGQLCITVNFVNGNNGFELSQGEVFGHPSQVFTTTLV